MIGQIYVKSPRPLRNAEDMAASLRSSHAKAIVSVKYSNSFSEGSYTHLLDIFVPSENHVRRVLYKMAARALYETHAEKEGVTYTIRTRPDTNSTKWLENRWVKYKKDVKDNRRHGKNRAKGTGLQPEGQQREDSEAV